MKWVSHIIHYSLQGMSKKRGRNSKGQGMRSATRSFSIAIDSRTHCTRDSAQKLHVACEHFIMDEEGGKLRDSQQLMVSEIMGAIFFNNIYL